MAAKDSSNAKIHDPEKVQEINIDPSSIKYELGRAAGAAETLGTIPARDLKRLAEKGMNATTKLNLLSLDYFPRLCEIIHRGLTFEEVQLLTGTKEDELRAAFRKQIIRRTTDISIEKASRDDWMNIAFVVPENEPAGGNPEGLTDGEQMLAPARSVKRRIRHRCFEQVSGVLPELYMFRKPVKLDPKKSNKLERLVNNDTNSVRDELVVSLGFMRMIRSIFANAHAPEITKQFALFYRNTREHSVHYAYRYKALNDEDTYRAIGELAEPLGIVETYLFQQSEALTDPKVKEGIISDLDNAILDIEAKMDDLMSDDKSWIII